MRRFKFTLESVLTIRKKALEDARIRLASITNILNRQNGKAKDSKLVAKFMYPLDKATKKIVKGIAKRKKRIVFGFQGRGISFMSRLCPKIAPSIITSVLKASKLDMFNDVFNKE